MPFSTSTSIPRLYYITFLNKAGDAVKVLVEKCVFIILVLSATDVYFPIFLMNFPKSFKGLGSTSSMTIRNKKVAACMFQIGLLSELNR